MMQLLTLDEAAPTVAMVGDFGLSRLIVPVLAGGEFNLNWLAPEVMREEQYTVAIDVYSYGIILNELWVRMKHFKGNVCCS